MDVLSTTYSHANRDDHRRADFSDLQDFADIDISEPHSVGYSATLCIRFRQTPMDLLFYDQLRDAVEQIGKFLRS
jgi:hypothetical protein